MQVIPFPPLIALLSVVLTLHAAGSAAAAVTLWQFGQGRLLPGQLTLPLQPLATATDGSATEYLYQVVNDATLTTTNAAGVTTVTFASASPRTIIASASGWVEPFDNGDAIECAFVDKDFGRCFQIHAGSAVPTNSGAPITQVLQIAPPSSTATSAPLPSSSSSGASSNSNLNAKHSTPAGAIAGAVIAVVILPLGGLFAFVVLRRRRTRRLWEDEKNAARAYDAGVAESIGRNASEEEPSAAQAELARGRRRKEDERFRGTASTSRISSTPSDAGGGSRVVSVQVVSELPTADLVQLLAERMRSEERAPPYALVERGDV
ncbi:hypothetical protein C8R46DRAFT_1081828 [Mycena filopes]|nr:hypothetical protein C8R46DRAFT_1081828 [Mycena filopes]